MAISPTGGVFSYLPHHLDLASEESVGHSTCMSVLARRRAVMGSIVQPKRSCLGAATGTAESPHRWGKNHTYPTAKNSPTTPPLTLTLTLTHQPPHDSPATGQHTPGGGVNKRIPHRCGNRAINSHLTTKLFLRCTSMALFPYMIK